MLQINDKIIIPENEIDLRFTHASGPGGQNVNKVASAVQLRFDVQRSPSLPEQVRERILTTAGNRLTREGILLIESSQHRSQDRNRKAALDRLRETILEAVDEPLPRKPTKPSLASRQRRLTMKRMKSARKRLRRPVDPGEE